MVYLGTQARRWAVSWPHPSAAGAEAPSQGAAREALVRSSVWPRILGARRNKRGGLAVGSAIILVQGAVAQVGAPFVA